MLRQGGFACHVLEVGSACEALSVIARQPVDLVIVDVAMPGSSGLDLCRRLKSGRATRLIPILVLTSATGAYNEASWIESGVDEILKKPAPPQVVRARVHAMLRHKALVDSLEEAETILFALAQAVERRDPGMGRHCERLAAYSTVLGRKLGLRGADLRSLYQGGFLHDIGKISVPDAVLFKPGPLSDAEWEIMQRHTLEGEAICRGMKSLTGVLPIIRSHHERWDGSGYPDGLHGEQIPLLARVLQVADIYDALLSRRPYKASMPHDEAVRILTEEACRGLRDPSVVQTFAAIPAEELTASERDLDPAPDLTRLGVALADNLCEETA